MKDRAYNDRNQSNHPEPFYKDEWVLTRKSLRAGGIIVDRQIQEPDEIEVGRTEHHILGYLLNDFAPRQVTCMDNEEYDGINTKGDFWLKPSECNGFWHWESTDEALMIAIEPTYLRKVAAENNCPNSEHLELNPVVNGNDRILDQIANGFFYEMTHSKVGSTVFVEALVDMLTIHILRNYCNFSAKLEKRSGGLSASKLKLVTDYINDYLANPLKVEEVASLLEISHFHFSRLFKQSTGMTPHRYIMEQRVIKAKELLKNSALSFDDIARNCGFTHQSHMGRIFKEHTGTTPRRYRQEFG